MSTKGVALSFCLHHAQVLPLRKVGTFACPYPMPMGPMGGSCTG
jgi:hypothetical protein